MTTPTKFNEFSQAEEPARVLLEKLGWTDVVPASHPDSVRYKQARDNRRQL